MKRFQAKCRYCGGVLKRRKVARFGFVGALFGWLVLLPSIALVSAAAAIFVLGMIGASTAPDPVELAKAHRAEMDRNAKTELLELGVPVRIADLAIRGDPLGNDAQEFLTEEQFRAADRIRFDRVLAGRRGPGLSRGGFVAIVSAWTIPIVFVCSPALLIGFVLASRKRVLRCSSCSAAIPAA